MTYTIEFQKRGLPHVHILLWLQNEDKCSLPSDINRIISAEIPNKKCDLVRYKAVTDFMIHGPCGNASPQAPCMIKNKCSKFFPKKYQTETSIDANGFPIYRRRETSKENVAIRNGIEMANRFVVPHNGDLIVKYQAHVIVEICSKTRAIKYLLKYKSKGPNRSKAILETAQSRINEDDQQWITILMKSKLILTVDTFQLMKQLGDCLHVLY